MKQYVIFAGVNGAGKSIVSNIREADIRLIASYENGKLISRASVTASWYEKLEAAWSAE